MGESPEPLLGTSAMVSKVLGLVTTVFGFPLMFVPSTPIGLELSRRVFGGDTGAVFGLSAVNSLLWAIVIMGLVRYARHRPAA
jgi:hypothetical protein